MIKKKNWFIFILVLIPSVIFTTACMESSVVDEDCNGHGTLKLTNKSSGTIQRIQIDGVNYGTLDPGETERYSLPAGRHSVETFNVRTGNYACSSFNVIIVECETEGFDCSG